MILPKGSTVLLSFNGSDFALMCEVRSLTPSGTYTLWVVNGAWEGELDPDGTFRILDRETVWPSRAVCAQVVSSDRDYNEALSIKPTVHDLRAVQFTPWDRSRIFVARCQEAIKAAVHAWTTASPHSLFPSKPRQTLIDEFDDDIPF